ncbi:MAG TPA: molybdopterin-dependent oxidoreductase [Candidatus Dormibacteraeota bacterium]|nr:molybdopterin-dependent oxidoreductase [Candidatus Dormibacteraeota bacterium]
MTRNQAAWAGFAWGCVGGTAVVALMYYAGWFLGLRTLPDILSGPLLSVMPGPVFGFLIDTLQHAGKVVEELGLIVGMILGLGALGAVTYVAGLRWTSPYLPFAFAALGWLVVTAVLLPVGGRGLLGLDDSLETPFIWAVLFAIYAVILQYGDQPAAGVDMGRRRVLSAVPISIFAVSVGALAVRLVPDWYSRVFAAPEFGLRGISPAITPVENFYVVSKNFADPAVDAAGWRLRVGGMVDKPATLGLDDLRALPSVQEYVTLECISNNVGGPQMSTGLFTGVRLRDLVGSASPQPGASWVSFKARDGYTESLPLSLVSGAPEILVAFALDGAPLPQPHGFPARILIPGHYGMKGPKWLENVDLASSELRGYWEQQGWDHNAVVKTTARFDVPVEGDILKLGAIQLGGVAFAGTRGISRVEFTTNGSNWVTAEFETPLSPLTWVIWRATWTPGGEGAYRLMVRAVDASGAVQDSNTASSYPSGSSGYHTVQVSVSR